jgi:hypothetical protein
VGSTGNVRSLNYRKTGEARNFSLHKYDLWKNRYQTVALCKNKIPKRFTVHSLVARAFIGERPLGYVINHIDHDIYNNSVTNLEYITHSQNHIHAILFLQEIKGTSDPSGKSLLSDDTVREMLKAYYEDGCSFEEIYETFTNKPEVDKRAIRHKPYLWNILLRHTCKYVRYP